MNSKIKMLQTKPKLANISSNFSQTKLLNPTNQNFCKPKSNSKGPRSPTC